MLVFLFLGALFISFLMIYFPHLLSVTCPDLLSVLTPSMKCLLPGRSVYHWRRRRNNHRLVVSFSPHLPSLPLTSASNSGHVCFPAPNFLLIHFTPPPSLFPPNALSSSFLLCCLPGFWKPHSVKVSGCLCLLFWVLHHCSQPATLQLTNTVRPYVLSAHSLCLSTESDWFH